MDRPRSNVLCSSQDNPEKDNLDSNGSESLERLEAMATAQCETGLGNHREKLKGSLRCHYVRITFTLLGFCQQSLSRLVHQLHATNIMCYKAQLQHELKDNKIKSTAWLTVTGGFCVYCEQVDSCDTWHIGVEQQRLVGEALRFPRIDQSWPLPVLRHQSRAFIRSLSTTPRQRPRGVVNRSPVPGER